MLQRLRKQAPLGRAQKSRQETQEVVQLLLPFMLQDSHSDLHSGILPNLKKTLKFEAV